MTQKVLAVRYFPEDLKRELKVIAAKTGVPLRAVIIKALRAYVKEWGE